MWIWSSLWIVPLLVSNRWHRLNARLAWHGSGKRREKQRPDIFLTSIILPNPFRVLHPDPPLFVLAPCDFLPICNS